MTAVSQSTKSWLRLDGSDAVPVSLAPRGASVNFSAVSGVCSPDGRSFAYRLGDGVSVWGLYVAKRTLSDGPLLP